MLSNKKKTPGQSDLFRVNVGKKCIKQDCEFSNEEIDNIKIFSCPQCRQKYYCKNKFSIVK